MEVVDQILNQTSGPVTQNQETPQAPPAQVVDEKPKDDDKISSKLELLIRREKAAWERERAAKASEEEIRAFKAEKEQFEQARKDPKKALELLGLSYDELTQNILKDGEYDPQIEIKRLREELDTFKKSQDESKNKEAEERKRQAEAREKEMVESFKSEIKQHIDANQERYELIKFENHEDIVYDVIEKHYERTRNLHAKKLEEDGQDPSGAKGDILSIADAADKVEKWLEEKAVKSRELKKIQALFNALPKQAQEATLKQIEKQSQPPKTLTNQLSATPTQQRKTPVSDEERIQRAIAYARGLRPSVN